MAGSRQGRQAASQLMHLLRREQPEAPEGDEVGQQAAAEGAVPRQLPRLLPGKAAQRSGQVGVGVQRVLVQEQVPLEHELTLLWAQHLLLPQPQAAVALQGHRAKGKGGRR